MPVGGGIYMQRGDWREAGARAGSLRVIGGVQGSCLIAEVSDEIVDLTHSWDARPGTA
jgi:hypothetical protein